MKRVNVNPNVIQTFTQNQAISKHLLKGKKLNPLEAFNEFGTMKLATRISELKTEPYNLPIEKTMITTSTGKRVAEYRIEKDYVKKYKDNKRKEREKKRNK